MDARGERYERVKDLLSQEEFERRTRKEMEAWGGLLNEEASALLVLDELGRNEVAFGKIGDLYEGGEALLVATVRDVGPVRAFTRRDGDPGRVVHVTISDPSGTCRLVLWDEETDLVSSGAIREGATVKIVDGYVRPGRDGLEVVTGKWGVLLPENRPPSPDSTGSQFRF